MAEAGVRRVEALLDSLLPGACACEEIDARRLVDQAVSAALFDAAVVEDVAP